MVETLYLEKHVWNNFSFNPMLMRKISYFYYYYYAFRPVLLIFHHLAFFLCVVWVQSNILITFHKMEPDVKCYFEITLIYAVGSSAPDKSPIFTLLCKCRGRENYPTTCRNSLVSNILPAKPSCETRLLWEKNLAHAKKLGYSRFKLIPHDIFKNPCKNVQKSYSM